MVIVIAVAGLAAGGGAALVAVRLRHGQPRTLPPGVIHARPVSPATQDRPEPRALPAGQELHLHFHGVTAEDVAEVLARVNREDG